MMKILDLTVEDFARSFGTTAEDIPEECKKLIDEIDFRYEIPVSKARDKIILDILRKIDTDQQVIGAKERQEVWEKGWSENLQSFIAAGNDINKLVPRFIRPNQAVRLNQDYVIPSNPNFELDYYSIFRLWLFKKYFQGFSHIYEFGCGTGFNLAVLARLYPKVYLYGLDFVPSSPEIVNKLAQAYGWNMKGYIFDMISPDEDFDIKDNSLIFTIGALEQLASKFERFLQFLLKRSPSLCVHVEPTIELYDKDNLVDHLAIKFHKKRGYTENYLTRLRELELQDKIEIIKIKRLFFGSLYMEGYTCIVWKPK